MWPQQEELRMVHPVCFTFMERAPCVILLVGATQCGPNILKETLAEIPGPAFICGGVGLARLLIAHGLLGVHLL